MLRRRKDKQRDFFSVTDNVSEKTWYWAAIGSIIISAMLKMTKRDDAAIFVGQWAPSFLLFGLFHRLLQPSRS
jgi:hypothetical protein